MPKGITRYRRAKRERLILVALSEGKSNREIARELGLALPTVRGYVSELLIELEARTRTHAVVIAIFRGLVRFPPRPAGPIETLARRKM